MCGIAGLIALRREEAFCVAVDKMTEALVHRGPDSGAVERIGTCLLGNRRLAIVDLSERGRQPMPNEDGTVWITYNGECYNAPQLREMLQSRGHSFRSTTDTEVILHLYEELGDRCVEQLRGMFAFAIWDQRAGRLLLARDRLGIKPLYFSLMPQAIAFASEIKALLVSGIVPAKINGAGIRAYLQLGHIPPPWTPIQAVEPLGPGEIATWQGGTFQRKIYWRMPESNGSLPDQEDQIAHRLQDVLLDACRVQLMSDVPMALFLSGGVDSAAIGSLMRHVGARDITALTVGFEEAEYDESAESSNTAALLGFPHTVLRLSARHVASWVDSAISAMDQPTTDGLNAYWVSRAAAGAGFKVAFSGQGGDELFGGYDSLKWFERFTYAANWLRLTPRTVGSGLFDHDVLPFRWRKLSYLFGADDPFVAAQLAVKVLFLERDVRHLLNPALLEPTPRSEAFVHLTEWADRVSGCVLKQKMAFMDIHTHLEPRLLRDADAMSMSQSLELRPIFLDHVLIEYLMSLPAELRLRQKKLLLEATREIMPRPLFERLVSQRKRTFTLPFARWLVDDLRGLVEETLDPARLQHVGVFQPHAVASLWRRYQRSPAAVGWSRLWSVFVLQRWCEMMRAEIGCTS
jgi:asparagine synthase (glutamine-hydrolysing)